MKMNKNMKIFGLVVTAFFIISSLNAFAMNVQTDENKSPLKTADSRPYDGQLRVYVVEPVSRWDNYDDEPYHYAFLDYAIDEELSIEYQNTYNNQVTWNAADAGYQNVQENNIMVIAAVFNPESFNKYAYPPMNNPFQAYYVDAATGAKPGETNSNIVNEEFTHTVFCEEATATWCKYCPAAAEALGAIYDSGDYPFYFVAMVADMNDMASDRIISDYNLYGYPTSFFDGGYKTVVGSGSDSSFRSKIESCGRRDVHELDLSLSVEWTGNGILDISVSITSNEETENIAPAIPTVSGRFNGGAGKEYTYKLQSVDPDGDDVYYCIEWGDETDEICIGPYTSGEEVEVSHTWTADGEYEFKVKAKDIHDHSSDWASNVVNMPKQKSIIKPANNLLLRFSNIFSFLKKLI